MKISIIMVHGILFAGLVAKSQTKCNLEGGYFGENITYPGVEVGFELEKHQSETFSTPFRANVGFYSHPRSAADLIYSLLATPATD
jgi:hypothetical protein